MGQPLESTNSNVAAVPGSNSREHAERGWALGGPQVPSPDSGWQGSGLRCFKATDPAVGPVLYTQKTPDTYFLKKRRKKGRLERDGGKGKGGEKGGSPRGREGHRAEGCRRSHFSRELPPGPREITDILPLSTSQAGIPRDPMWHASPVRGPSPRLRLWWPRATCPHTRPLPRLPGGALPTRGQRCSFVRGCAQNQGKATDTRSGTLLGTWGTRPVLLSVPAGSCWPRPARRREG